MKKAYLLLQAAVLLILPSCQKHFEGEVSEISDGTIHKVSLGGFDAVTRCGDISQEGALLTSDFPLTTSSGDTLFISVYLSDTETPAEEITRSTPIKNLNQLAYNYAGFYSDVYKEGESTPYVSYDEDGTGTAMSQSLVEYYGGWNFQDTYFWPLDKTQKLYFCSYAPTDNIDGTEPDITNKSWDKDNKLFKFDYKIPFAPKIDQDATVQNDILVAVDKQAQETYNGNVHVNFKHAMVGVRFIKGTIKDSIKYIGLDSLYSEGTLNVKEDTLYWTGQKNYRNFSQEFLFDPAVHPDDLTPIDSTATEDLTYMMIPQVLPSEAKISIWIGKALHSEKLSFNDLSSALVDWSKYAGKTITFRISSTRVNNVNVTLEDEVDQNTLTKHSIVITNKGISPLFIRAVLVGNWLNKDDELLASWSEDNTNIYGYFNEKTTPAASTFPKVLPTNWIKHTDGFYYYKKYLKSDKVLSTNLFNTFTITGKPVDNEGTWKAPEVEDVDMEIAKFEMAILLQAVKADAGFASAKAAWGNDVASFLILEPDVE